MNNYAYDGQSVGGKALSVGGRSALGRPLVGGWSGWVNRAASCANIGLPPNCIACEQKTHIRADATCSLSRVVAAS
jgi:hypothetical protein